MRTRAISGENQKWLKQGDQIKTVNGKCLDVKDGNTNTGARVILWSCHNGDNQKWRYINGTIQSKMGSCLEVVNADPRDGTPLQTSVCQGKASQQWSVEDRINAQPQPLPQPVPRPIPQPYPGNLSHSVKIIGLANKCLDVADGKATEEAKVIMYSCHGGANQSWRLEGSQIIGIGNKCLEINNANRGDGGNVVINNCDNGDNQSWKFVNGLIQNKIGTCLDVANASTAEGTAVKTYKCHGRANQLWRTENIGSEHSRPSPIYPGSQTAEIRGLANKCLEPDFGKAADGTRLVMNTCNGKSYQQYFYV